MMQSRLLLSEDSGDGISISVRAGRHISTVFLIQRKRESGRNIILQSTDQDEQETLVPCRWSHLGHSGNHDYLEGNQSIHNSAIGESLVAVADYRFCAGFFLPDVQKNR